MIETCLISLEKFYTALMKENNLFFFLIIGLKEICQSILSRWKTLHL